MSEPTNSGGIAIIGMAGRFPGAADPDAFWRNLCSGHEAITFFDAPAASRESAPLHVAASGHVDGVALFDAAFFNISPRDAEVMDPQHRVFLECAWEALERAGYADPRGAGRVGVFAGAGSNRYADRMVADGLDRFAIHLANDTDFLATRVSHKLNLTGPGITVQTACSTSLVAVCLGCQSLAMHVSDMVLAGGVSISIADDPGYEFHEGGILSPDGHCRAFDAAAAGTVPGSGAGIVVLKRLEDAIADGDHIHAVIKGWALNNDGAAKAGFTAPSPRAQTEVIVEALAVAGVAPRSVGYVEAHGTATQLGDAVELAALTRAFREQTDDIGFCALGSVKTNVGHLDTAAGVASLIKAALAVEHGKVPPSLHFTAANPELALPTSPFFVATSLQPFPGAAPRRAGVSSFGIGGTNAHLILEEPQAGPQPAEAAGAQLFVLSARSGTALAASAAKLAAHMREHPDLALADIAFTLQCGRQRFGHRRFLVCRDQAAAIAALEDNGAPSRVNAETARPVAFMFTGQGERLAGAGVSLYRDEKVFRDQIDLCSDTAEKLIGVSLRTLLCAVDESAAAILSRTEFAQPALFALEFALAKLWESWGVRPVAMIGHSVGEYTAACLAGVFAPDDALHLLCMRGRLMQRLPPGAMLAVQLSEADMTTHLLPGLSIAAVNAATRCVVAGPQSAIADLDSRLGARGVACQHLATERAFHSAMVEPCLDAFDAVLRRIRMRPPQIPLIADVTGDWLSAEQATDPAYWVRHLREAVRFHDGVRRIASDYPNAALLEVGPGTKLARLARLTFPAGSERPVLASLATPDAEEDGVMTALGALWAAAVPIDWSRGGQRRGRRVVLPTYPFERQRYWVPAAASPATTTGAWMTMPSWRRSIAPAGGVPLERTWLVFDCAGTVRRVSERLRQAGRSVVTVRQGCSFCRIGDHDYAIRAGEAGDYARLLAELAEAEWFPDAVLHGWLSRSGPPAPDFAAFTQCQESGFTSLLLLVQALTVRAAARSVGITLLVGGVFDVGADGGCDPAKATIAGAAKVIGQEHANLACRVIDIGAQSDDPRWQDRCVERVLSELAAGPSAPEVAYRGADRWTPNFEELPEAGAKHEKLRQHGVYLITGGLGRIGLDLAEHLARRVAAKLVLVGRTPLPPRTDWDRWLHRHDAADRIVRAIVCIRRCEEQGAEVLALAGDVADEDRMKDILRAALARFGALHGVIHAAAETAGPSLAPISALTPALCERQFQAKAAGLYVLDRVLEPLDLDFCLVMSSLSTVLGGLDMTAYAAANCFADAFVQQRNRTRAVAWTAVDWDGWRTSSAVTEPADKHAGAAASALTQAEGLEAFQRVLRIGSVTRVVVAKGDLAQRRADWLCAAVPNAAPRAPASARQMAPRPGLREPYVAPQTAMEHSVVAVWQDLFRIAPIGAQDNFFELGGDSLMAVQLVARLRQAFGLAIPVKWFFDHPTPSQTVIALVQGQAQQAGGGAGHLLAELAGLSDAEVEARLVTDDINTRQASP
jgi:acyl transferase domain-containing protein/acyl carrier protein